MIRKIKEIIPQKAINYLKHLPVAVFSTLYYCFPSANLRIIGVTGTDGKTTTVSLIYHILNHANLPVAMVSTVSAKIGAEEIDTGFHVTAPEPKLLQKLLRKMVDHKIKYAVLEMTSHGLDQFRLWGVKFEIGVVTNVTRDHLDYHKTYEEYLKAKAKLFDGVKVAVLNRDDRSFEFLGAKVQRCKGAKIVTYGIRSKADFTPKTFNFRTSLPGEYNQYNCLAAIAVCSALGIPEEIIKEAVETFKGVIGRMEEIDMGQNFKAIVDFAHTPNGLEQALMTLQEQQRSKATKQQRSKEAKRRLIAVFGCAGLRDKGKRPLMGEIAGKYADMVILTAEDPRTERVEEICNQIAVGCLKAGLRKFAVTKKGAAACKIVTKEREKERREKWFGIVPDRQEAINLAVGIAEEDDIVVVCGKGHERSMCFGTKEYPWSDQEAVRKALLCLKKGDPA